MHLTGTSREIEPPLNHIYASLFKPSDVKEAFVERAPEKQLGRHPGWKFSRQPCVHRIERRLHSSTLSVTGVFDCRPRLCGTFRQWVPHKRCQQTRLRTWVGMQSRAHMNRHTTDHGTHRPQVLRNAAPLQMKTSATVGDQLPPNGVHVVDPESMLKGGDVKIQERLGRT